MVGFLSATQSNVWSSARFLTQLWLFVIFQFCKSHHTYHHHHHLHRVRSISPGWSPSLLQDKVEENYSNSSVTDTWTWKLTGFRRAAQLQNSHLQRHQRGLSLWSALSVRKPHVQRYSSLPPKYATWTWEERAYLAGRCALRPTNPPFGYRTPSSFRSWEHRHRQKKQHSRCWKSHRRNFRVPG